MKHIVGVLLVASTIGLAIAATSSAGTDGTETSCAALEAALDADAAAALKAARAGNYTAEIRIAKEVTALTATARAVCAGSNAPVEFSSGGLPEATLGTPYRATTFCSHIVGHGCDDARGKPITFRNEGDLLPLGMRFDPFTGTVSGTPNKGQSTRDVPLRVCSRELLQDHYTNCIDVTLHIKKRSGD